MRRLRLVGLPVNVLPPDFMAVAAMGARALIDPLVGLFVGPEDARGRLVNRRRAHNDLAIAEGRRPPFRQRHGVALAAHVHFKGVHFV